MDYMPFNSVAGDRIYKAEDWAWYFGLFISNGVFANPTTSLQVMANSGMSVNVKPGAGFVNGYAFKNSSDSPLTLDVGDGTYNRIDRIVLRWDLDNRLMCLAIKKGTAASSPTAPTLTRNSSVYELALADIAVARGAVSISQVDITDQRGNTSLCNFCVGMVDQIDWSALTVQLSAFMAQTEQDLNDYMDYIHNILDSETASHLLNLINALQRDKMEKGVDYVTAGALTGTTLGTGSTAEGRYQEVTGDYSHGEGQGHTVSGDYAHGEGSENIVSGDYAHAEGLQTTASGAESHAEGHTTTAGHAASHAEGYHTQTGNDYQHVQGIYNIGKATTAFEIGNGDSNTRANIAEIDWSGNATFAGDIEDGDGNKLSDLGKTTRPLLLAQKLGSSTVKDVDFNGTADALVQNLRERITVPAANWSASADSRGYYKCWCSIYNDRAFASVTADFIDIYITGANSSTQYTAAQVAAYRQILGPDNGYVDIQWRTISQDEGEWVFVFYAKTKPTVDFYVLACCTVVGEIQI